MHFPMSAKYSRQGRNRIHDEAVPDFHGAGGLEVATVSVDDYRQGLRT
jgi:hypothetical protein